MTDITPQPSVESLTAQLNAMTRRMHTLEDQLFDANTELRAQKELNLVLAAQLALSPPHTPTDAPAHTDEPAAVLALLNHGRRQGIEIGLRHRGQDGITAEQVFAQAMSRGLFTRHTDKAATRVGHVQRYTLHEAEQLADILPETNGEFVTFVDYDALKTDHQFLLQQYHHLCAALSSKASQSSEFKHSLYLADGKKVPVVHTPKTPGKICFFYGRYQGACDHYVTFGSGVPSCDRALVMHLFNTRPMAFDYVQRRPTFGVSFLDELHARGYDIRTLRFSVERLPAPK